MVASVRTAKRKSGMASSTLRRSSSGSSVNTVAATEAVRRQTIAPHAATPVHRHDCEEVIVCLKGAGVCHYGGREYPFREDETLVIPSGVTHQICNAGDGDLYIVATLAMAPVKVETATGEPMPLPWNPVAA